MIKVWVNGERQGPMETWTPGYTILPSNGHQPENEEPLERLTNEEMRHILSLAVRRTLDIDVDEFIARYRAGEWPDPDGEPNISYLVALDEHTL